MIAVKISERVEPHCIVWAHAMAGLWGISRKHDLDEPVPLSQAVPVRLRYAEGARIITDRTLTLKTIQAGRHVALRFVFRDGTFLEVESPGISEIDDLDMIAEVSLCS